MSFYSGFPKKKSFGSFRKGPLAKTYTPPRSSKKAEADRIRREAKKMLFRLAEKKETRFTSNLISCVNAANTAAFQNNIAWITPNSVTYTIGQGVTQNARVGNKCRLAKCIFHLFIAPNPYDATANSVPLPQVVTGYFFSLKQNTTGALDTDANTVCLNSFLQTGSGSAGFTGTITDQLLQPNLDQVTVYKKVTFKVGAANYQTNTGTQANYFSASNNDYQLSVVREFDVTDYMPKLMTFNDTTTTCNVRQLFFVLSPNDGDGGANADTTAAIPLSWKYNVEIKWTDI